MVLVKHEHNGNVYWFLEKDYAEAHWEIEQVDEYDEGTSTVIPDYKFKELTVGDAQTMPLPMYVKLLDIVRGQNV